MPLARPFTALRVLAALALGTVLLSCAAPASRAETLKGGVQQDESPPQTGDVFNSRGPALALPYDPANICQRDTYRLAHEALPPGWGPHQYVSIKEMTSHPSDYWARCAVDACHPDGAVCWRNLNYGPPPPGWTGYYPPSPQPPATPPYTPPIPGGYNVCNNPNAWRIPQCRQQAAARPARPDPAPTACEMQPTPVQRAALRRTGIEALDTAAAMGSQADRMGRAFGVTIAATAAQLLDPKAFLAQQVANARMLLTLLATDNRTFNEAAYSSLIATLRQAERDPARALGAGAAQYVLGRATTAAAGAACKAAVRAAQAASTRLRAAADRLKKVERIASDQPLPAGAQSSCPSVNPTNFSYACFQRSLAYDLRAETGHDWTASNFKWSAADAPTPTAQMKAMLASLYGDRRFATMSPEANLAQAGGNLIPATLQEIKDNLRAAGNGARGLLLAQPAAGAKVSHVFNIAFEDGTLRFFDAEKTSSGLEYLHRLFDTFEFGADMRFWLYRTDGPDRLARSAMRKAP
jgi:hypothetical protein